MTYKEKSKQNFHIARIINLLLCQQIPLNTHGLHGMTTGGNIRCPTKREAVQWIVSSLHELGFVTWEEYLQMKDIVKGTCSCEECVKALEEYHKWEPILA